MVARYLALKVRPAVALQAGPGASQPLWGSVSNLTLTFYIFCVLFPS
jgi:hypothetical protein